MAPKNATALRWYLLALATFAADQATKAWAEEALAEGWVEVTGFFNLVLLHNTGSAFSFLADAGGWQQILFGTIALGISAALALVIWKHPAERLVSCACALVIGGALGNLLDRLRLGGVTDFLDFHAGALHWPAFNVADSAIVLGVFLFLLSELRSGKK